MLPDDHIIHVQRARKMAEQLRAVGVVAPQVGRIAEIFSLVARLNEQYDSHLRVDSYWTSLTDEEIVAQFVAVIERGKRKRRPPD